MVIEYRTDLNQVDWGELKATLSQDNFDNGRSPEQLQASFENSDVTCLACTPDRIIGRGETSEAVIRGNLG